MDPNDFERLKASVRQMMAIKNGEASVPRSKVFVGKILREISENGEVVWSLGGAAAELREAVDSGEATLPNTWAGFVRLLRDHLRQSQEEMAELLGVSLAAVQHWEQGRREPTGPARALLQVAARYPEQVLDAVSPATAGFHL